MSIEKIDAWAVKRWEPSSADAIVRVEFVHVSALSMVPAATLATWHAPISDPHVLVREAYEESLNHAESQQGQGPQRYAIRIFRESNPRRAVAQYVWLVDGPEGQTATDGQTLDPPTATGLLQIAMRGLNDTLRSTVSGQAAVVKSLENQLRYAQTRITELENERQEYIQAAESVFQHKHERDLELARETRSDARKAEALASFKLLIPIIGARVAEKVGLAPASPDVAALDQLFASLNEEQFATMLGTLNATQRIALLELLKKREAATRPANETAEGKGGKDGTTPTDAH